MGHVSNMDINYEEICLMGLVAWLASLFASVVSYLSTYIGKKIAMTTAAISSLGAIIITFKIAVEAGINGLNSITPNGALLFGLGLLPDNTGTCIAAILTTQTTAIIYRYYTNIIDFSLKG